MKTPKKIKFEGKFYVRADATSASPLLGKDLKILEQACKEAERINKEITRLKELLHEVKDQNSGMRILISLVTRFEHTFYDVPGHISAVYKDFEKGHSDHSHHLSMRGIE